MEIYFVNICTLWLYNLYQEYIENIILFIRNKFNKQVHLLFINENDDYIKIFNYYYMNKNKYIFSGNIEYINILYEKYRNRNFYFLNIEQMSKPSYFESIKKIEKTMKIIDYSEENIPFLQSYFKKIFLLPPYYLSVINSSFNQKNLNIISISNNEYRKNYLSKINNKFDIYLIDNLFGKQRDDLFLRSKIYINIHSSTEHKTMELIRIVNLLKKNVIVLTQTSIFPELINISKSFIVFNNLEQLEYLINDILNNYSTYYNYIFSNENLKNYDNYVYEKIKKILLDN